MPLSDNSLIWQYWNNLYTKFDAVSESIVRKITWYEHKNKDGPKWNRIKDTKINTSSYTELIFDKSVHKCMLKRNSLLQTILCSRDQCAQNQNFCTKIYRIKVNQQHRYKMRKTETAKSWYRGNNIVGSDKDFLCQILKASANETISH